MLIKEQLFRSAIVIYLLRCHSVQTSHEIWPYPINRAAPFIWPNFHGLLVTLLMGFHCTIMNTTFHVCRGQIQNLTFIIMLIVITYNLQRENMALEHFLHYAK